MKKLHSLFCICAVSGMLFAPAAANAAIDAAGAAQLKQAIDAEIQWRKDLAKLTEQELTTGPVQVTPKNTFYEVKIPDISTTFNKTRKLVIGTVTVNATPGKTPGEWQTSTALPSKVTLTDDKNTPLTAVTIGHQETTALWIPAKNLFPKVNVSYGNVAFENFGAQPFVGTVKNAKFTVDLKDNGNDTWSGPSTLAIDNIRFQSSASTASYINVRHFGGQSTYEKIDVSKTNALRKTISDMAKEGRDPTSPEVRLLMTNARGIFDSFSNTMKLEGVQLHDVDGQKKAIDASIEQISFNSSVKGAQQEQSTIAVRGGFTGLKVLPPNADLAGMIPDKFNMDLTVDKLPLRQITDALSAIAQQTPADPNANPFNTVIPPLLQKAGTYLAIKDTYLRAPEFDTILEGRMTASTASPTGMMGKITISMKGIDKVIAKLQTAASQAGADPKLGNAVNTLTAMMMLGQPTAANVKDKISTYVFEATPDGRILFNGVNMQMLINAGKILNDRVRQNQQTPQPTPPQTPAPAAPPI